ncbi:unnamed protein product [Heligmosomoides polygyrus]|uniref:7TM_GPCR_Srx domain-containing protein n=1 Tax=Heligmosomoides polygyrus TaxID=6339 RepID=A0A183GLA0_HELPZ|nr:unnamed protein product [Heligmosomoides polygyrus]
MVKAALFKVRRKTESFPSLSLCTRNVALNTAVNVILSASVFQALMVVGWLYSIGVWLWGCLTQNLTLNGVGWGYDLTKPGASTLADLEIYVCFPSLGITYIAYLVIVVHFQKKRNISSTTSDGKRELKIFLQATFLCTYMITLITMWHNAGESLFFVIVYLLIYLLIAHGGAHSDRLKNKLRNGNFHKRNIVFCSCLCCTVCRYI